MAAITELTDLEEINIGRRSASQSNWSMTALTASMILAIAAVIGPLWVGAIVAGLFVAGNVVVAAEGRSLSADEFAAIGTLHAAAAIVLALSL